MIKNENGEVVELRCFYDPDTKGGSASDGIKGRGKGCRGGTGTKRFGPENVFTKNSESAFYSRKRFRMIIGIPKEMKSDEYRVSLTPAGVQDLVACGHAVLVEDGAGEGSGLANGSYEEQGAQVTGRGDIFSKAEMIVKVKEPLPEEVDLLREGQILYTYLHLAPAPELTRALLDRRIIGIAYETVQLPDNSLPLLIPMSEVAGRMSVHEGAKYLERENRGRGILLGGV